MSSLYISTCRKPTQRTRILAKALSRAFNAGYENRGKRSLGDIEQRAKTRGLKRLAFIYERHGNPTRIAFYEDGWLAHEIKLVDFEYLQGKRMGGGLHIDAVDLDGKEMAELFALEEGEGGEIAAQFRSGEIRIEVDGILVLKMRVALKDAAPGE